jgi:hypothetical protein
VTTEAADEEATLGPTAPTLAAVVGDVVADAPRSAIVILPYE